MESGASSPARTSGQNAARSLVGGACDLSATPIISERREAACDGLPLVSNLAGPGLRWGSIGANRTSGLLSVGEWGQTMEQLVMNCPSSLPLCDECKSSWDTCAVRRRGLNEIRGRWRKMESNRGWKGPGFSSMRRPSGSTVPQAGEGPNLQGLIGALAIINHHHHSILLDTDCLPDSKLFFFFFLRQALDRKSDSPATEPRTLALQQRGPGLKLDPGLGREQRPPHDQPSSIIRNMATSDRYHLLSDEAFVTMDGPLPG